VTNFPFIVVSPQCPNGEWWSNEILSALLDEVMAKYRVDSARVYLTGLSMGGFNNPQLYDWFLEHERKLVK
jgi:poly(3-hydroxybutyrate) depolymerase